VVALLRGQRQGQQAPQHVRAALKQEEHKHYAVGSPAVKAPSEDTYGSPTAPVISYSHHQFHPPGVDTALVSLACKDRVCHSDDDTHPNALHVIAVETVTSDTFKYNNIDEEAITKHDENEYGSPRAHVVRLEELTAAKPDIKYKDYNRETIGNNIEEIEVDFNESNVLTELNMEEGKAEIKVNDSTITFTSSNDLSSNQNHYPAIENIPQQPSADFPDQTNPEKYLNNDQETLEKVVNTPLFYNDPQAYFRIYIVSDIST